MHDFCRSTGFRIAPFFSKLKQYFIKKPQRSRCGLELILTLTLIAVLPN